MRKIAYRAIVLACLAGLIAVAIGSKNRRRSSDAPRKLPAAGLPRVLLFTQGKCGICKPIIPVMEDLARSRVGKMSFEVIDIVERQDLTARYGIQAVPTLLFLDAAGTERYRQVGFMPREKIIAVLTEMGVL